MGRNRGGVSARFALKDGAVEQIDELRAEYKLLERQYEAEQNSKNGDDNKMDEGDEAEDSLSSRMRAVKVILDCAKALEDIETDLELFEEQMSSDDETVKATATTFMKEFLSCKEDIETQLKVLNYSLYTIYKLRTF
eukprot:CAMPEP_0174993660 /NCGR_PEP_ID=MMETSP0004_2-20121128/23199_1 /TAXON_ID=420556 /ORGANISM="Ochromonas sp., Strain CCMP1393" /LENGTH=136 /DNA_ID=CAMNT_0016247801 /DNA_START=110 /DNA_END=520 /DNA_ORIENTATION=+